MLDDDDLLDIIVATMPNRSVAAASDARPSRGDEVRRAAQLTRELRRMLEGSPAQLGAARDLFRRDIAETLLTDELIELGHALAWPDQSLRLVTQRLVGAVEASPPASRAATVPGPPDVARLIRLPLDLLDRTTLRQILETIVTIGYPIDVDEASGLPPFVDRLGEALLATGGWTVEVEARLRELRRWMDGARGAARDARELAHSLARRLVAMEQTEGCRLPPRLRDLWLHRRVEAETRGVRFDDPVDGCYRSPLARCPMPFVSGGAEDRILLIATSTNDGADLGAELADQVVNGDVRFALDLGRPLQREGYIDYAVLLVTGADWGTPEFLRQECAASDDWLR
ncbi:MAG: hypothetical protein M3680_29870 [Myxococcota bacterium]|nr:hypothetical protein [Myxococcota bacterium]